MTTVFCHQLPIGLGPEPSAESSCHKCNDNVLCTLESFTPSSCPLLSRLYSLWDLLEVRPGWQPWGSIFTSLGNSRLRSFVSPCHLLSFFPLQTVSRMSYLNQTCTPLPIATHLHEVSLNHMLCSKPHSCLISPEEILFSPNT